MLKHDANIAARFSIFRKEYIAKGQHQAAKLLECSQSKISDIESGKLGLDFNLVQKMSVKFQLNIDWLATGRGKLKSDSNEENLDINKILVASENMMDYILASQKLNKSIIDKLSELGERVKALEESKIKKSKL